MSEHAILAPSSADQWGRCSGSVRAQQAAPQVETLSTREGTAAHWAGTERLVVLKREGYVPPWEEYVGLVAPNGVIVTEEMAECADVLVQDVLDVLAEHPGLDLQKCLFIEHRVAMPTIHPDNWGTPDVFLILRNLGKVYLWDYKHGHGRVDAFENFQLVDYSAGVSQLAPQIEEFSLRIVQPRYYRRNSPVDVWNVSRADLAPVYSQLHVWAHKALGDGATLIPGKHCRYCSAIIGCQAVTDATRQAVNYAEHLYQIDELTPAQKATEREILLGGSELVKARIDAIEDSLTADLEAGRGAGCGLVLEAGRGRLTWSPDAATVAAFCDQFGVDVRKLDTLTPAQAKKKVAKDRRAIFEQAIKSVTHTPSTGMKLRPASDSRVAAAFANK